MVVLEQLKMLVNVAMADGNMSPIEKQFIKNIGVAHGFPESSVETLFYEKHDIIIPDKLTIEKRFDIASELVRLMMLDRQMFLNEIEYCSELIQRLGFEKRLVYKLTDVVVSNENADVQLAEIRKDAINFSTTGK